MPTHASAANSRIFGAALLSALLGASGIALAEEPVPEPEPEMEAEDEADEEQIADEEESADEEASADEGETADDEWEADPMEEDEEWAADVVAIESDDAIPVEYDPESQGAPWEVTVFADDGDNVEDLPAPAIEGVHEPGDLPVIRRAARKPGTPVKPDDDVPYSTGGKPVRDGGVPWQAQIYYPRSAPRWAEKLAKGVPLWQLQHFCGGTLIAPDWVLTAAHCIDEVMVKAGYRVRLGAQDISKDEGWTYQIDRIVRHSGYGSKKLPESPNMYANDIALVHIVEDVKQKPRDPVRVRAIPLYERPVPAGAEVSGTGWGKTQAVDGSAPSAMLMKVDLRAMDTERCQKLPDYGPQKIHGKVICAAHPERSTCQGDSGGALTLTNGAPTVVGVVSWGKKRCAGDGQPGAYTRVESYLGWIRDAMRLDPTRNSLP